MTEADKAKMRAAKLRLAEDPAWLAKMAENGRKGAAKRWSTVNSDTGP
jgi:hypothetical protein